MHFPGLLRPQDKKEIELQVAIGHFSFLNRPSIVSERKVRGADILAKRGFWGSKNQ